MTKYTLSFEWISTFCPQGVILFHKMWTVNEKVQSREDQPKLLVMNYLMNLYDKTQVQWFTQDI